MTTPSSAWQCATCSAAMRIAITYPPGPDVYCAGCKNPLSASERLAAAVSGILRYLEQSPVAAVPQEPKEHPPGTLLTVAEAAELLRLSEKAVYNRAARGQFRAVRVGRSLRFRREELLRFRPTEARVSSPGSSRQ